MIIMVTLTIDTKICLTQQIQEEIKVSLCGKEKTKQKPRSQSL